MGERPFQSLTSESQQAQAMRAANTPTIAVHGVAGLRVLLPVPSAPLGFGDVAADADGRTTSRMRKPFVVISGLPGSGKTTLGRRLAPSLNLPLIDKDDILDRLFESKGVGNVAWRRTLSRESDVILQHEATNSNGAILASFWRVPGMPSDSGTPTDWLDNPSHHVVNLHCICDVEVAASRLLQRRRHPGHLDGESSSAEVLVSLRKLTQLPPLAIGQRIDVDTSQEANLTDVVRAIRGVLELLT